MSHSLATPRPAESLFSLVVRFFHGGLLGLGAFVLALGAAVFLSGHPLPEFGRWFAPATPEAVADVTVPAATEAAPARPDRATQLAEVIAKRYKVAQPVVVDIVRIVDSAARQARLDPLLILAMIGVESRYNPYSESAFGAQGLMQVIGRFHGDKFEPRPDGQALLDPETNIRVGVLILREYLKRTGDLEAALKLYGGESDESGAGYADKVLAEKDRLLQGLQRAMKG